MTIPDMNIFSYQPAHRTLHYPQWNIIGWELAKGDRIKRFNVYGRASSEEVNGIELAIFTLAGQNGGPITQDSGGVMTSVERFIVPTPSSTQMLRYQSELDFEIEQACTLAVCYRSAVKPAAQRAFSHTIECLIEKTL